MPTLAKAIGPLVIAGCACLCATAEEPVVIYSNLADTTTNQIPGGLGSWDTDFSFFTLNISPSGQYWLLNFQEENTNPEVLIAGSGLAGSPVLVEGVDGFDGRTIDGIDSSGRINDSGQWAIGGDLNGSSTSDDVIVSGDLGGLTTLWAQEGSAIPAIYGFGSDSTWDTLDSTAIDASGTVYWAADALDGADFSSANDEIIATSSGVVIAQKGVTVPTNQPDPARPYDDFDLDDLHVSADGMQVMVRGDIGGSSADDDALFVNDAIVVRENFTLSAIGITGAALLTQVVDGLSAGIDQQFLAPNGDWYVFGQLIDAATNWAVRNGALIAASGDPITVGASETWDDPNNFVQDFSVFVGNGQGDYLLGGETSAGDSVLVLNGTSVLLRTGDPVQLDGATGVAFFDSFEFQETRLGNDMQVYSLVNFRGADGTPIGSGFITLDASSPSGDQDGDGVADSTDNCVAVANADQRDSNGDGFGNVCDADLDNNCVVNFVDLGQLRTAFFSTGPDADFDGDGVVNFVDLGILRQGFFEPPGPSGIENDCD